MAQTVISSADNKLFKALCRLLEARGLKKQKRTIVAGAKLVRELVAERPLECLSLIISDRLGQAGRDAAVQQFAGAGKLTVLKHGLFSELDIFKTGAPLLEITVPAMPQWNGLAGQGCTLLLPFQDPANVGAVCRSAAAFGVRRAVLLQESAHPFHPKSIRASAGAVFKLSFLLGPSLGSLVQIPEIASRIIALDMKGLPISEFSFPSSFLLLPGVEGRGLPEKLREQAVAIPMPGGGESLNAATAASIALFCWSAGPAGA